jgi:hypothetical protein
MEFVMNEPKSCIFEYQQSADCYKNTDRVSCENDYFNDDINKFNIKTRKCFYNNVDKRCEDVLYKYIENIESNSPDCQKYITGLTSFDEIYIDLSNFVDNDGKHPQFLNPKKHIYLMGEIHRLEPPFFDGTKQYQISIPARDLLYNLTSKFYDNNSIDIFVEMKYQNLKSVVSNDWKLPEFSTKPNLLNDYNDIISEKYVSTSNLTEYSELVSHLIRLDDDIIMKDLDDDDVIMTENDDIDEEDNDVITTDLNENNNKTRIHYTDVRFYSEYYNSRAFITIFLMEHQNNTNLRKFYPEYDKYYNELYIDIVHYHYGTQEIKNEMLHDFFEYYIILKKYSKKSSKKYPLYDLIKEYIIYQLKNVLDNSIGYTIDKQIKYFSTILAVCAVDFYTLNRMFSLWTHKNTIFFGGYYHAINILKFFNYLQNRPQYNISVFLENSVFDIRNIVNVSSFNTFFKEENHSSNNYYNDQFNAIIASRFIIDRNII